MTDLHLDGRPGDDASREDDEFLRALPESERQPRPELVAAGWERRFMADGPRLKEYSELYRSLGFEVHVEPIRPDEIGPDCTDCSLVLYRLFATLYTRRPAS